MAPLLIIAVIALGLLILGPQLWVKKVIEANKADRPDMPGTGGELAEHLIEVHGLEAITVEKSTSGDHYDPQTRTIRLAEDVLNGKSVTAVAIAAHEFGHALQHSGEETGLKMRQRLVKVAMISDKIASVFFIASPVIGVLARSPAALLAMGAVGIGLLSIRILVHLVTLPVEFDASFRKALPILERGGYLDKEDMPCAQSVLKAAALTYVSSALVSLIDLARWIRIIR